jgi:predicted negative regulator of RcsB-dependent stress response
MQSMVGDITGAKATASTCSNNELKSETYRYIGEIQAGFGDNEGAKDTLLMAKKAALAHLSSTRKEKSWIGIGLVAIEQARVGDFQGAAETLQLIEDTKSREGYQITIASFQTDKKARKAIDSVKDPYQKGLGLRDTIQTQAHSGKMAAAWDSAKEIVDLELRIDAYIVIAEAEGDANDRALAYALAKATAAKIRIVDGDLPIVPTPCDREFHKIAASQAQTGDVKGAKAIAALIKDPAEKAASFVDIARAQLSASDRQGARATLANAITARAESTGDYQFMQELASALAEAGDLPEAITTASLIARQDEPKDHAYEKIIDILLGERKIRQARETVAHISDPRWKGTALASIGAAESSIGDIIAARKTFAEARSITATVPAKAPDPYTWDRSCVYHYVAMKQAETGDFEEIRRWIPLIRDPRDRVNSWLGAAAAIAFQYYDDSRERAARNAEQRGGTRPTAP